jgi:hypothetical protein
LAPTAAASGGSRRGVCFGLDVLGVLIGGEGGEVVVQGVGPVLDALAFPKPDRGQKPRQDVAKPRKLLTVDRFALDDARLELLGAQLNRCGLRYERMASGRSACWGVIIAFFPLGTGEELTIWRECAKSADGGVCASSRENGEGFVLVGYAARRYVVVEDSGRDRLRQGDDRQARRLTPFRRLDENGLLDREEPAGGLRCEVGGKN